MKFSRRKFLKLSGATGAIIVVGVGGISTVTPGSSKAVAQGNPNARYGMFIDLEKCIGCHGCTMACMKENNMPEEISGNWVLDREIGEGPGARSYTMPLLCMHCENPACAHACPVKATYKRADGIVVQDNTKCIGCKYCMQACPYRVRQFNKKPPFSYRKENPLGVHVGGTVIKCTFCQHRIDAGNLNTACNDWCPTNARVFGDLNDPNSEVSKLIIERNGIQLLEEKLTKPQIYYGLIT